jgi:hypothetical protein
LPIVSILTCSKMEFGAGLLHMTCRSAAKFLMRYLNNSQVGSVRFNVLGLDAGGGRPTANWSLITANFSRVDEVIISGSGSAFLLDIHKSILPSPNPPRGLLGFAGLGFLAYRRQEKTVPLIGNP